MLIVSEVAEAVEDFRDGKMLLALETGGKPVGFPAELADIIIRTLDLCAYYGIDIDSVLRLKHEYNKSRPRMHGGKKC